MQAITRRRASERAAALLQHLGIRFGSAKSAFVEHIHQAGPLLFYRFDGHLTPEGHRVVAGELTRLLSR